MKRSAFRCDADQCSGMIRSVLGAKRRWFLHFVKVIAIVSLLLELWKVENRSCDFQGRFSPVFSTAFGPPFITFPPSLLSFTYRIPRISMRCALWHQAVEDSVSQCGISRSVRASETPAL